MHRRDSFRMELVRADGHQQQQWALANVHTKTIARILSEHLDDDATLLRAVVELLGLALIKPRYGLASDECANSRRFFSSQSREKNLREVDIAAISHMRCQLEGYECKLNARYFVNINLVDLAWIYKEAGEE